MSRKKMESDTTLLCTEAFKRNTITGINVPEERELSIRVKLSTKFTALASVPGKPWIITGSSDGTLQLWDTVTGRCKTFNTKHNKEISCILAIPQWQKLISCSGNSMKICDLDSGQLKRELSENNVHNLIALDSKWGPLQKIAGLAARSVKIWDMNTGKCIQTFGKDIDHFSILPNGYLVSGQHHGAIHVWNPETSMCINTINEASITLVAGPNGHIVNNSPTELKEWDPMSGTLVNTFGPVNETVLGLAILSHGQIISWGGNSLNIWDAKGGCFKTIGRQDKEIKELVVMGNDQLVNIYKRTLKIYPRTQLYAVGEWQMNPDECDWLCVNIKELCTAETLDFSGIILSSVYLPVIAESLRKAKFWQRIVHMCPYNDQGFQPLDTFFDDKRINFQLEKAVTYHSSNGDTILHHLVNMQQKGHNTKIVEKLLRECLSLGASKFAKNHNGKTPVLLAKERGANNLVNLLEANRPALEIPQLVLDWCCDNGWDEIHIMDGSRAEIIQLESFVVQNRITPAETQVLSVQQIDTRKRNMTQTTTTTANTEQQLTLKLDRTLAASNKQFHASMSGEESGKTLRSQIEERSQNANNVSHEKTTSMSGTSTLGSQKAERTAESQNWRMATTVGASVSFSFMGIGGGVNASTTNESGKSKERGTEDVKTQNTSMTNQNGDRNSVGYQSMRGHEQSLGFEHRNHKSTNLRNEEESQNRFSVANAEQQYQGIRFTSQHACSETLKEGHQFIITERKRSWTEYKTIDMQFSLGGQVGIITHLGKEIIYIPLCEILEHHKDRLQQVYPDYRWDFSQDNVVYCNIGGNYIEQNIVNEKAFEEHPLYRIKRLVENLVVQENHQRQQAKEPQAFWLVNVSVDCNSTNPYSGTLKIRCSPDVDTRYLKRALKQFIHFSEEESFSTQTLCDDFRLMILEFNPSMKGKAAKSGRDGLMRTLSSEFQLSFFNQKTGVNRRSGAAFLMQAIIKLHCLTEDALTKLRGISTAVLETSLELRFKPAVLGLREQICIDALRLSLVNLLHYTHPEQLLHKKRYNMLGICAFYLDFSDLDKSMIDFIHREPQPLGTRFKELYSYYMELLTAIEPGELQAKTQSLYLMMQDKQAPEDDFGFYQERP